MYSHQEAGYSDVSEIEKYSILEQIPYDENNPTYCLQFWEDKKKVFKNLYPIAIKYLTYLASSTPSERLFSSAANYFSSKRIRMTPEHLTDFCMLKNYFENMNSNDNL